MKLVLASRSPRRKRLLQELGLQFEVMPSNADESSVKETDPVCFVKRLAELKAETIARQLQDEAIVLGADSMVFFKGEAIGKAKDESDAYRILSMLSSNTHRVLTGICIMNSKTGEKKADVSETFVTFRKLTEKEINDYIATGEPMDGAGAYTDVIHSRFFEKLQGSHTNVIGLPLEKAITALREFGVEI